MRPAPEFLLNLVHAPSPPHHRLSVFISPGGLSLSEPPAALPSSVSGLLKWMHPAAAAAAATQVRHHAVKILRVEAKCQD